MKVVLWILVLAALAGFVFVYRRLRRHHTETFHRKARNRNSIESRAERDRLDIEALTQSLAEPARSLSPGSPSAGAAREERGRRAAAHSAFDPDLPAPVRDSAARP